MAESSAPIARPAAPGTPGTLGAPGTPGALAAAAPAEGVAPPGAAPAAASPQARSGPHPAFESIGAEGPDPRMMLTVSLALVVGAVATPGLAAKIVYALGAALIWTILRLGVRRFLLVLAPLALFLVMTFVLRAVIQADQYADATRIGAIPFSFEGLLVAVSLALQVFTIVLALSSTVLSNPPLVLSEATELLLRPLARLKVPVHEGALMFSIALRFIPIMAVEFRRLTTAQATRGAGVANRNMLARTGAVVPLVIPLFVVTLIRARELSEAIESRGYTGGEGRTPTRLYRLAPRDLVIGGAAAATVVVSVLAAVLWR